MRAEEECICTWAEFLKRSICWCEERASCVGGVIDDIEQTSATETQSKGAECTREMSDNGSAGRWWEEDAVYSMYDTIGRRLY